MFDHKSDLFWCYIIDTLRARTQLTSALTPSGCLPQAHCRNTNIYLFIYSTQQKGIKGGGPANPPTTTTTTTHHRPKFCPIMHNLFKIFFPFFFKILSIFSNIFKIFPIFSSAPPPKKKQAQVHLRTRRHD